MADPLRTDAGGPQPARVPDEPRGSTERGRRRFIVSATLIYGVLALAWILLSDRLLGALVDLDAVVWFSTAKGVFFVLVSAAGFHAAMLALQRMGLERQSSVAALSPVDWPRWTLYAFALTLVALMLAIRLMIPAGDRLMLILFTLPISLAALIGGLGPGLVATAAAALLTDYFLMEPVGSLLAGAGHDLFQWGFLIVNGVTLSLIGEQLLRSRARDRLQLREIQASNAALRASEARLQQLLSDAPVAMGLVGWDGRILVLNRCFLRLFGYRADQLVTLDDWWGLAHPDPAYRHQLRLDWERYLARRDLDAAVLEPRELRITAAGGSELAVQVSARRLDQGVLITLVDVTERHRAQQALQETQAAALAQQNQARIDALGQMQEANLARGRAEAALAALQESEHRLALFIDHAPAALAMFDREMRYVAVSRRWRDDYGLGERPLTGQSHYDVFPEIGADIKAIHQRGLAGEVLRCEEDRFTRLDGRVHWLRWEVHPWQSPGGHPQGIVIFSEDISARKNAEDELHRLNATLEARVVERTAALEALNQSLESFVYSVSHDLKAPLRGVEGYSRFLQEDHGHHLDDEGRLFLGNIRAGVARMGELIDDLLTYSRMERRPLQQEAVDLCALVRRVLAERADSIADRGVLLQVDLPATLLVLGDREGLEVVLRNLLENALKFSARTPVAQVTIENRREGGRVVLSIRDNGVGFDMKYHDRIFEIFQRLQRVEDYPGTGIGLALVKKAMQRMGGEVRARSAPGQGATFSIELPAATALP